MARTTDEALTALTEGLPSVAVVSLTASFEACTRRQLLDELEWVGVPVVVVDSRTEKFRVDRDDDGRVRYVTVGHPVAAWAVAETARWLGTHVGPVRKGPLLEVDDPHLEDGRLLAYKRGRVFELEDGSYAFAGAYARVPVPRVAMAHCSHLAHPHPMAPDLGTGCYHGYNAFDLREGARSYGRDNPVYQHCPVFDVELAGRILHAGAGWGPFDFRVGEWQTVLAVEYPSVCAAGSCDRTAEMFRRAKPREGLLEVAGVCPEHLDERPVTLDQLADRLGVPVSFRSD